MLITLMLALACLMFDLLTPLSTGEWALYLIPMLLTRRVRQPRYPLWFAGVCTVFTAAGLWLAPPGMGMKLALISRSVGVVVFWLTALLMMERKRAEQAFQIQEQRLRAILDHAPVAIFVKDLAGRYIEFSRQCEINMGRRREEVVGQTDRELFPADVADRFQRTDETVLRSKQLIETQMKLPGHDGERTTFLLKFPLFDTQGRCTGLCGISADVTKLMKTEEALRKNQQEVAFYNRRLSLLAQVTAAVVGTSGLNEEAHKLAEQTMLAFETDACVIRSLEGDKLALVASAGMPGETLPNAIPAAYGPAYEVMAKRRPMFFPDVRQFAEHLPEEHRFISYAGAPLVVKDEIIGMMGIYSKKGMAAFSDTDLEHLQIAANHIAVAIANDRLFKDAQIQRNNLAEQVAERHRAQAALNGAKERLQSLSRSLLEMQEMERRHIARELHDEIGQALTALKINLQAVQRFPEKHSLEPRLLDSINIVDRTLRQVRNLSLDLRPSMLDDFGLCAALRWYADQQAQRAGLQVQFVAPELPDRLDPTLETACFRVAQEALTNIVRHAKARSVMVRLEAEADFLHLTVRDDGIGFDLGSVHRQRANGASLGLLGMKERASLAGGRVELRSRPGEGTEVHGWFPQALPAADAQPEMVLK